MFMITSLVFTCFSILCVRSFPGQRPPHDITCPAKGGSLCVLDELKIVQSVAEGIAHKSMEIEKSLQQGKGIGISNKYVQADLNYTRLHLPTSFYHEDFCLKNNINKVYLTKLILEGHDAMIFFYNSISDLLNSNDLFSQKTDESFGTIRNKIEDHIICQYRSILDTYSRRWKPINHIRRMQFQKQSRLPPSDVHHVHSLVIARHLVEWMQRINQVIKDLPMKYA